MDDVAREAQERGYFDGNNNRGNRVAYWKYTGHLAVAYERGYKLGREDWETGMKEKCPKCQCALEIVKADPPWTEDHYQCPICDGTYNIKR
jgi:hypothetical protein